jgi:hypothetical protein
MPLEDFEALVDLLVDGIITDVVQSNRRCEEPIYPRMVAAIGIRVLAGGNYDDIMNTFGIRNAGFCYTRNKFINAVLTCNSLDTCLPTTPVEWSFEVMCGSNRRNFSADNLSNYKKVSQRAFHEHITLVITNHMT